ncbi:hypothetical protein L1887_57622 [Cichorium endivia]|nr:hypothetical protein L1887_57622 [Cichorium endivia]
MAYLLGDEPNHQLGQFDLRSVFHFPSYSEVFANGWPLKRYECARCTDMLRFCGINRGSELRTTTRVCEQHTVNIANNSSVLKYFRSQMQQSKAAVKRQQRFEFSLLDVLECDILTKVATTLNSNRVSLISDPAVN